MYVASSLPIVNCNASIMAIYRENKCNFNIRFDEGVYRSMRLYCYRENQCIWPPSIVNCNASIKITVKINGYFYIGFGDGVTREI